MRCDVATLRVLELASISVLVGLALLICGWLYAAWFQWRQRREMAHHMAAEAARKRRERPTTF